MQPFAQKETHKGGSVEASGLHSNAAKHNSSRELGEQDFLPSEHPNTSNPLQVHKPLECHALEIGKEAHSSLCSDNFSEPDSLEKNDYPYVLPSMPKEYGGEDLAGQNTWLPLSWHSLLSAIYR